MESKQKELKSRLEDLKKYQQEQESILQVRNEKCREIPLLGEVNKCVLFSF